LENTEILNTKILKFNRNRPNFKIFDVIGGFSTKYNLAKIISVKSSKKLILLSWLFYLKTKQNKIYNL
jgi:hypothetical protein